MGCERRDRKQGTLPLAELPPSLVLTVPSLFDRVNGTKG